MGTCYDSWQFQLECVRFHSMYVHSSFLYGLHGELTIELNVVEGEPQHWLFTMRHDNDNDNDTYNDNDNDNDTYKDKANDNDTDKYNDNGDDKDNESDTYSDEENDNDNDSDNREV